MPKNFLTRSEVRELDRRAIQEFETPGIVLMENAGRGVVEKMFELGLAKPGSGPVVICCGKGNNGGDGFVIARHLDLRRVPVSVLLFCSPHELRDDAATNFRIVESSKIPLIEYDQTKPSSPVWEQEVAEKLAGAGCIVDALLGTGVEGAPRFPLDRVISLINRAAKPVVAVDVPSGLDCDSGKQLGDTGKQLADTGVPAGQDVSSVCTIRATHTCTFVAAKPGFATAQAKPFVGTLHIIDIGAPRVLVEEMLG
jgi:NAD(P)H-hydrate epimerase